MTNITKLLLGVGAIALGYYLYKNYSNKKYSNFTTDIRSDWDACLKKCSNADSIQTCATNCMKKKGHITI